MSEPESKVNAPVENYQGMDIDCALLGIRKDATKTEASHAFRKLSVYFHSDKIGKDNDKPMQFINAAYGRLLGSDKTLLDLSKLSELVDAFNPDKQQINKEQFKAVYERLLPLYQKQQKSFEEKKASHVPSSTAEVFAKMQTIELAPDNWVNLIESLGLDDFSEEKILKTKEKLAPWKTYINNNCIMMLKNFFLEVRGNYGGHDNLSKSFGCILLCLSDKNQKIFLNQAFDLLSSLRNFPLKEYIPLYYQAVAPQNRLDFFDFLFALEERFQMGFQLPEEFGRESFEKFLPKDEKGQSRWIEIAKKYKIPLTITDIINLASSLVSNNLKNQLVDAYALSIMEQQHEIASPEHASREIKLCYELYNHIVKIQVKLSDRKRDSSIFYSQEKISIKERGLAESQFKLIKQIITQNPNFSLIRFVDEMLLEEDITQKTGRFSIFESDTSKFLNEFKKRIESELKEDPAARAENTPQ